MSFSSDIKKELTGEKVSEGTLLALIRMNGSLTISSNLTLAVTTENAAIAQYIYKSLLQIYDIKAEIRVHQKTTLSKNRVYTVLIEENVSELLNELHLADSLMLDSGVPEFVKSDEQLKREYLSGAFLAAGTVKNPEKGEYQLSIYSVYQEHAEDLQAIFEDYQLSARVIARKNRYLLYLSKSEEIMDFLTLIGANQARLRFENAKIYREMRGLANRQSNFENANIEKTVSAAQDTISAIKFLIERKEFENLPSNLTEIAKLRIENPERSIKDLGEMLETPIGKSGVNHRLRKLVKLAEELKND